MSDLDPRPVDVDDDGADDDGFGYRDRILYPVDNIVLLQTNGITILRTHGCGAKI